MDITYKPRVRPIPKWMKESKNNIPKGYKVIKNAMGFYQIIKTK